ncbi:helix-turn-helix domain-containing protein [Ornithinibacillus californiensis]|uniref:helix-turn-helix domain-containing protein n=1 Tax=Ornithinibacillus californiensis TaxID=161536 RepID=UPI00064DFE2A|nr:helix-turn-helix transcriptional regulator [Ornithinibacillus californiensis]
MSTVGERIKQLRKEKKLTLAQLAQDKMSAAMVSLIENGKSKPSAENLEHIANVLNVSITDLLGGTSREELRRIGNECTELLEERLDLQTLQDVTSRLQEVLPNLGHNAESANIYKLYARCIYWFYLFYNKEFDLLQDKDYELYYRKAEEIYLELQMESKAIGIKVSLVQVEATKGNYQKAIEMINDSIDAVTSMDSYDTVSNIILLKLIKIQCLDALGDTEETFHLLHELVDFSNEHLMLNNFFEIYNTGAMLYYQENDYEKAREFVAKINKFFEIVHNENLIINKELIMIHYMEFFEERPELALQMIQRLEEEMPKITPYNESFDQSLKDTLNDMKARCYTKLHEPEKALPLFRELLRDYDSGLDYALREVNKSYQALCYLQLQDQDNALTYAKEGVSILKKYPRTAYYHFALNVLKEVQQMK